MPIFRRVPHLKGALQLKRMVYMSPEDVVKLGTVLFLEAKKIMTRSKSGLVPVKSGNLRASGKVRPPQVRAGFAPMVSVELEYGGAAAPDETFPKPELLKHGVVEYAALQHEVHATQSKFLEAPTREALPELIAKVGVALEVNVNFKKIATSRFL